ncbi:unnamed protein product [Dicrocoelium dendriticum]|nr:unnamed protein product [Dicrocoelium dendriticum]
MENPKSGSTRAIPSIIFEVVRVHPTEGRDCGHLEVRDTRSNAVQRYRLFDHVTVSIHVSESVTHGLGLRLQLVSGPMKSAVSVPTSASAAIEPDATKKDLKSDLIESVQAIDAERRRKRAALEEMALEDESAGLEQDELISKLHEPSSLYTQMHKILRRHDPSFATEPTN